ncbi:MAG: sulfur carrier protein ThiS [Akkermansiaceae bacterium]|nr:sulfur carrier protein ThiS [Akkermansiaceae bacterium]
MNITLNGKLKEISGPMTVRELLAEVGLEDKPVVVELNQQPVFPRDHDKAQVEADASVEIVALAAGG